VAKRTKLKLTCSGRNLPFLASGVQWRF